MPAMNMVRSPGLRLGRAVGSNHACMHAEVLVLEGDRVLYNTSYVPEDHMQILLQQGNGDGGHGRRELAG